MPNLERVTMQTSGMFLEEVQASSFPTFVEQLAERGIGFPIFSIADLHEEEDLDQLPKDPMPIIVYSGRGTFPIIADPSKQIPGIFALSERSLIYTSERVLEPWGDRDMYRWLLPPYHYFVDGDVVDVLKSFEKDGYPIYLSGASYFDFGHGRFQPQRQTNLQEILDTIK